MTQEFTLKKLECLKQAVRLNKVHGIMEEDFSSILLVFGIEVMIKRNCRGHSYCCVRGEILGS